MKKTSALFSLLFLFSILCARASEPVVFKNLKQYIFLDKQYLQVYNDSGPGHDISHIAAAPALFKPIENDVPHREVGASDFWIRFDLENQTEANVLLVTIENPVLQNVDFYYRAKGETAFTHHLISKNLPFEERVYQHQNFIFELHDRGSHAFECYIKINSFSEIQAPIYIGSQRSSLEENLQRDYTFGIYTGIMLVIFLYNLFILLTVKDKSYLYYILYILSVAFVQLGIKGFGFKYLWSSSPYMESINSFLFSALTAFTSIAFIRHFLQVKKYMPRLNKGFHGINLLYVLVLVLSFSGQKHVAYNMLNLLALLLSVMMMYAAIYIRVKQHSREAMFFIVAWSFFLGSVVVYVLKDVGVLAYNLATASSLQIGSALEAIMLSIALADRINVLKQEKEASQAEALAVSLENARIIKEQNIMLEKKVEERTHELTQTLHELKETQTQLVDAEKMASLGQLTAGVAHEINNPINFVSSNIKPLKRDIEEILSVLDMYDAVQSAPEDDLKNRFNEINRFKKDIDIDYLKEEVEILLKGMDDGASRTVEIVKGLKNFSRLDEADLKYANINEGIQSTLILLNNQLGDNIKVVRELESIPDIECYPGKLNQVFMNILNNAVYAVKKKNTKNEPGLIIVKTYADEERAIIRIKDNGVGMSQEVKNKIFEPFFTTKDVGEGTGLGLSIVYKIIESHKGIIEVNSEEGVGTEFVISLPKSQK